MNGTGTHQDPYRYVCGSCGERFGESARLRATRDALLKAAKEAIAEVEHLRENDKGLATKFPDSYRGGIPGAVDETFRRVLITLDDLRAAIATAEPRDASGKETT